MMDVSNRIRNVRRCARWLALLCVAALALAEQTTRSVKGVVRDQQGNPLNGAVVQIENTRTLLIRSYICQKDGAYQFRGLDRNVDYKLSAAYHHVASSLKTLSMFDERPVAVINLSVEVKAPPVAPAMTSEVHGSANHQ
jgi:hypothetical protein